MGSHNTVVDIAGMRFGRLVAIENVGKSGKSRNHKWRAVCDCGKEIIANGAALRGGYTRSCGCLKREIARSAGDRTRTHGLSGTSTYSIWDSMLQRCENPARKDYHSYGGVGISVCDRWHKFENFLEDMGIRPANMSIDRKDGSLGYTPENCRWATSTEQGRNQSSNRRMTYQGQTKCLSEWAEYLGIGSRTLSARLHRGWSDERTLSEPVDKRYSHT